MTNIIDDNTNFCQPQQQNVSRDEPQKPNEKGISTMDFSAEESDLALNSPQVWLFVCLHIYFIAVLIHNRQEKKKS